MANKAKKNNKNLIYGICAAAVVVVIAVVVAIIVMGNKPLDESFFVSDDTKSVLTMDPSSLSQDTDDDEYVPETMRLVYFFSGEKVSDLKMYYGYKSEEAAKKAADYLKSINQGQEIKDVSVNGKYVIVTADKSAYEDVTAEDAKQQVEMMEKFQNM